MLPSGYQIKSGVSADKTLLIKFLCLTYGELFPEQEDFSHLCETVTSYFSSQTPLWWVNAPIGSEKIACLWLGKAIDQVTGAHYSHIFLVYVKPAHRRLGIATALLNHAQNYAQSRGYGQIGLQVYPHNQVAVSLYNSLGYYTHSLLMLKSF